MAEIVLTAVSKTYPHGRVGVHAIDLRVHDGELLVIVGPSGCGKSTLLRLIAGLDTPTAGVIHIDGSDVTNAPPQKRDVAMVFQSYALYPHMRVRENLAYGLRVRGAPPDVVAARVEHAARVLALNDVLDQRPGQLSGGQRQRVALGRAIVREPRAFLLDEPLSNLDPSLRLQARAELSRLQRTLRATMVYVTHDQEEALTLGQRIVVMRDGRIEQIDAPSEVYARPANTFVAQFIGSPPMNLFRHAVRGIDADGCVIGIRAHDVVLGADGPLRAIVELVEPRGPDALVYLRLDDVEMPLVAAVPARDLPSVGSAVHVSLPPGRLHRFDARHDTGTRVP